MYLVIFIAAGFAELFVRGRLVVHGDAAMTAANILAHESLYRLGGVVQLIVVLACDTGVALLLYGLLKPVGRTLSLFAASFRLIFVAVMAANSMNYFAPLVLLRGAHLPGPFTTDQLQAMVLESHRLYDTGFAIALVFFGIHLLFLGWLVFKSGFLPRVLGALLAIAGFCYLTNSAALFLSPPVASRLLPYILLPGVVGEGSLTLWLLVVGLNVGRWEVQARA